jgi:hypothetical protein
MAPRRILLAWLAVALIGAQGLAFMHRIVHGPQAQLAAKAAPSWTAGLFSNHGDDSSCRLFDAVGQDVAASKPVVAGPLPLPVWAAVALRGGCAARFSAQFDARAPPAFR